MAAISALVKEFEKHIDWVFYVNAMGKIEWSNSKSSDIIGYSPHEIVGKPFKEILSVEANFEDIKKDLTSSSHFKIYSLPFVTKEGIAIVVELFFTPIAVNEDEKFAFLVFSRRIAAAVGESRKRESSIGGLSKKFVDTLISLFPAPVYYTDKNGCFIGCNKAFEEFFNLSSSQVCGKPVMELFSGENTGKYHQEDLDIIRHEANQTKQIELIDGKKEKHTALMIKAAYPDEFGNAAGLLGIIVDITPLKQEEDRKLRLEQETQNAQKLASLALLAGGVAHDFNNMLTVMLGNIELAISEIPEENPAIDYLKAARDSCLKAADLCRQMLIYTGKSPFHKKPVNLNSLLQEMDQLLQAAISRRLYIQYRFTQPLPLVEADPNQLRQAIMSLVVNASEAMGEKPGVITITTGYMKCDKSYLETIVPACRVGLDKPLKQGTYVFLEVTDTGCGIPEEIQKKIFDPFFTTKFFGRGLGLAAVLGIIRTHRGGIKVYSEVGKGTTFKILLPVNGNGKLASAHSFDASKSIHRKETVLAGAVMIVDDEEAIRAVAARIFRKLGLRVYEAASGTEALVVFNKHKDEIDYVFLDFTMPGPLAEEIFREMRLLKPGLKVVLCSGYAEEQAMAGFHGKGIAGFLQKPYDINELKAKILSLLPGEQKIHFEKEVRDGSNESPERDNITR